MDQERFINIARRNPAYVGYKEHPNGACTLYFKESGKVCCQSVSADGVVSTPKFCKEVPPDLEL